jgi:hypothetical protein
MSDTESVVSTVFDVSSVADQSDLETIESSDITRNIPTPYEYVSLTVNIEETLACDFKRHSQYYRTPGKFFPVGSPDAERRMYRLIDDFLETYNIPTARRAQNYSTNDESFEYPRFIPSPSIMLVFRRLLPFRLFDFLPVYTRENKPTAYQGSNIERLMYATINDSDSSLPDPQIILRSNRPFPVDGTLFQGLSSSRSFTINRVVGEPQTCLQPDSIQILERAYPIARDAGVTRHYAQCTKDPNSTSRQPPDFQRLVSVISMDDVVVDVDRSIGIFPSLAGLNTWEQVNRVMQISEYFIRWCIKE